jgi:hypothetical protein
MPAKPRRAGVGAFSGPAVRKTHPPASRALPGSICGEAVP